MKNILKYQGCYLAAYILLGIIPVILTPESMTGNSIFLGLTAFRWIVRSSIICFICMYGYTTSARKNLI